MCTLQFSQGVLQPVPLAAPGYTSLRRRASAPELGDLDIIYGNAEEPYKVGNCIRIQLQGSRGNEDSQNVTAKIIKTFTPFSMAAVLVVRIYESTMSLKGDFVLKVYDTRYNDSFRSQFNIERWNRERDMKVEKNRWSKPLVRFFHKIMADDWLYAGEDDDDTDNNDVNSNEGQDEDDVRDEFFLRAVCLKMYRAELEVYRQARQDGIDGTDVPRFISSVRIPPTYRSKNCSVECTSIRGIPGILIQYLPGFSLQALYENEISPVPRLHW